MLMFTLVISFLTVSSLPSKHSWFLCNIVLYNIRLYFHHQTHPWLSIIPALPQLLHFSGAVSNCPLLFPSSILDTFWPGGCHIFLFSFSYCSWGSHCKKTDIVCHSCLQLTVFCQNSLPWSVHLEWLCMAWLIASLSYASPFTTTNYDLWRGLSLYKYVHFNSKSNSGTVRN